MKDLRERERRGKERKIYIYIYIYDFSSYSVKVLKYQDIKIIKKSIVYELLYSSTFRHEI